MYFWKLSRNYVLMVYSSVKVCLGGDKNISRFEAISFEYLYKWNYLLKNPLWKI